MIRRTASEARRELFRLLDSVEKGEEVIVERRGTRFRLLLELRPEQKATHPLLSITDPDVLSGQWTWTADNTGQLEFQPRH